MHPGIRDVEHDKVDDDDVFVAIKKPLPSVGSTRRLVAWAPHARGGRSGAVGGAQVRRAAD